MGYKIPPKVANGGECLLKMTGPPVAHLVTYHYHTTDALPTEARAWYLNSGWTLSRFCQQVDKAATRGRPDADWSFD